MAVYPPAGRENAELECGGLPHPGRGNADCNGGLPAAGRGNAGRFTPAGRGNADIGMWRFTPPPPCRTGERRAVYPLPDMGTPIWSFFFIIYYLRPAGSDPEVVRQKNSFLKVSVSLGGFGPSVAHGKHSVRRRCVQATKNKAEICSLLDAIGRRSCGR